MTKPTDLRYSGITAAGTGVTMAELAAPPRPRARPADRPPARPDQRQDPRPADCAILTPSGAVLARGLVHLPPGADPFRPGRAERARADCAPAEAACGVRVTRVEPPGALEALFHANQPRVVLRNADHAQLSLRIDHITGPPADRTYYLEPAGER